MQGQSNECLVLCRLVLAATSVAHCRLLEELDGLLFSARLVFVFFNSIAFLLGRHFLRVGSSKDAV